MFRRIRYQERNSFSCDEAWKRVVFLGVSSCRETSLGVPWEVWRFLEDRALAGQRARYRWALMAYQAWKYSARVEESRFAKWRWKVWTPICTSLAEEMSCSSWGWAETWIELEEEPIGMNKELLTESAQRLVVVSRSHRSVCRLKEAEEVFLWTEELNPAQASGW